MIKMIIRMNENRIICESEHTLEKIYKCLDRIFADYGYTAKISGDGREYCGYGNSEDFGKFGQIYNGLRKQSWFLDNVDTWLLYNSDDVEDPNDFSIEDLLHYDGSRVGVSA